MTKLIMGKKIHKSVRLNVRITPKQEDILKKIQALKGYATISQALSSVLDSAVVLHSQRTNQIAKLCEKLRELKAEDWEVKLKE